MSEETRKSATHLAQKPDIQSLFNLDSEISSRKLGTFPILHTSKLGKSVVKFSKEV